MIRPGKGDFFMEEETAITNEEDIDTNENSPNFDEPDTAVNQIDEIFDSLAQEQRADALDDAEDISFDETTAHREVDSENEPEPESILNSGADSQTETEIPLEVIGEFGDGQWNKTYEEHGETAFDFRTGEMMSRDGSVSLTQQIRESASEQQAELHEQVIKNWMESSGGAQLIAFNEATENGVIVHVTRTWVEADGRVASETWSKAVKEEVEELEQSGPIDPDFVSEAGNIDSLMIAESSPITEPAIQETILAVNGERIETFSSVGPEVVPTELPETINSESERGRPADNNGELEQLAQARQTREPEFEKEMTPASLLETLSAAESEAPAFDETLGIELIEIQSDELEFNETGKSEVSRMEISEIEQLKVSNLSKEDIENSGIILLTNSEIQADNIFVPDLELKADISGTGEVSKPAEMTKTDLLSRQNTANVNLWNESSPRLNIEQEESGRLEIPKIETTETPQVITAGQNAQTGIHILKEGQTVTLWSENQTSSEPNSGFRESVLKTDFEKGVVLDSLPIVELPSVIEKPEDVQSDKVVEKIASEADDLAEQTEMTFAASSEVVPIELFETVSPPEIVPAEFSEEDFTGITIEAEPATEITPETLEASFGRKDEALEIRDPEITSVKTAVAPGESVRQIADQEIKSEAVETGMMNEQESALEAEQAFITEKVEDSILEVDLDNQEAAGDNQSAKPIIIKVSQQDSLPFRPEELISRLLAFKPSVVSNDDEAISDVLNSYLPEFELAA